MSYSNRRKERISKLVEAAINRIESHIQLNEDNTSLKIGIDDLSKVNADQLSKIAQKTDVNVVDKVQEAGTVIDVTNDIIIQDRKVYVLVDVASPGDQVEFTSKGKKYTAVVSDEPKGTSEEKYLLKGIKLVAAKEDPSLISKSETPEEEEKVESTQQENAVYNLKNWATQLQVEIGEGETGPNNSIKFGYFSQESNQQISILVLSNGLIKMSGHSIQDFKDFKNIVEFHKEG